jgi:hypothetical protein
MEREIPCLTPPGLGKHAQEGLVILRVILKSPRIGALISTYAQAGSG